MATPLSYFQIEAVERLERLSYGVMALERSPGDQTLIDDLFREAHSLKGAAGVSGLPDVSEICHRMEDLLSSVRDGSEQVSTLMIDALLAATDAVQRLVSASVEERDCDIVPADIIERLGNLESSKEAVASTAFEEAPASVPITEHGRERTRAGLPHRGAGEEPEQGPKPQCRTAAENDSTTQKTREHEGQPVAETVQSTAGADTPSAVVGPTPEGGRPTSVGAPGSATDTVRLRVDMLETLGNRTGELMVAGDRLRQRLGVVRELHSLVGSEHNRHHNDHKSQQLLKPIATIVHRLIDEFTTDLTVIEPLIAEIHEGVLDTRMLPLSVLFDKLPRFVRDYCRQENKQAELRVEGADTRVDRQVLEQLRDPMIHLIRNALSHGIESPQERKRCGKNPSGTVRLTTSRRGDWIRITCEDDGRGIDRQKVLAKAVAQGLITEAEAAKLPAGQVERLILHPGFSTTEMITDVSGRGVGMDVVLSRMEALRGTLDIESEPGKSTRFALEFPASVATLEGLLAEVAGHTYVVPTISVVSTARVKLSELQTGGGGEVLVNIEGQAVPLVMLASLLGRGGGGKDAPHALPVVIVRHRDRQVALGVDRLRGTQTIVGKGLGDHIRSVRGVAGATILGTGLPAIILEPAQLVQDGGRNLLHHEGLSRATEVEEKLAPLLVVDDSITTRMMEQSILESAGYTVDTAVSAEDALARIEDSTYRLFVVDVEMPGLNGFELTRKLRQDERFAETPIVIVTARGKEEDRREGLEAGANAYIVKGEFDQNNLLETIERLVGK
jgi:two-component system chemotaxis sensor kinase CheA